MNSFKQDMRGPVNAWLLAIRPKTLTAAMTPVLVGSAVAFAQQSFRIGTAAAALVVALMIQIGTNLHNDVTDYERGTDTSARLGPVRVTQAGLLSPVEVRRGVWVVMGIAGLAGLYLVLVTGWEVLILGLASILAGLAYTSGPYPLAEVGLGDLFVMIFFGFVAVCGTVYVQVGEVTASAWIAGLAVGSTITALLVVNNLRDIETDRQAGRKTLAVRFGRPFTRMEYIILMGVAYLCPMYLLSTDLTSGWVMLPLLSLPLLIRLIKVIRSSEGRPLNKALAGTGQLIAVHGLLLAAGFMIDAL